MEGKQELTAEQLRDSMIALLAAWDRETEKSTSDAPIEDERAQRQQEEPTLITWYAGVDYDNLGG